MMPKRADTDPSDTGAGPADGAPEQGDGHLADRLERLNAALDKARPKDQSQPHGPQKGTAAASGMALAFRLGSEFVAGVLVGSAIGWGVDTVFSVAPLGMIVFTLLGFAAGVLNMMRAAGEVGVRRGPKG